MVFVGLSSNYANKISSFKAIGRLITEFLVEDAE